MDSSRHERFNQRPMTSPIKPVFTDEDLLKTKEALSKHYGDFLMGIVTPTGSLRLSLTALLYRLECAEALLNYGCLCETAASEKEYGELNALDDAWLQSKGEKG